MAVQHPIFRTEAFKQRLDAFLVRIDNANPGLSLTDTATRTIERFREVGELLQMLVPFPAEQAPAGEIISAGPEIVVPVPSAPALVAPAPEALGGSSVSDDFVPDLPEGISQRFHVHLAVNVEVTGIRDRAVLMEALMENAVDKIHQNGAEAVDELTIASVDDPCFDRLPGPADLEDLGVSRHPFDMRARAESFVDGVRHGGGTVVNGPGGHAITPDRGLLYVFVKKPANS